MAIVDGRIMLGLSLREVRAHSLCDDCRSGRYCLTYGTMREVSPRDWLPCVVCHSAYIYAKHRDAHLPWGDVHACCACLPFLNASRALMPAEPTPRFADDPSTGFYIAGSGSVSLSIGGVDTTSFTPKK
jgi:hypothetical protein